MDVRTCLLVRDPPALPMPTFCIKKWLVADDAARGINAASRYSRGRTPGLQYRRPTQVSSHPQPITLIKRWKEELYGCTILYMLVPMNQMKASTLDGLEPGVLPVAPLTRTFTVASANGKRISISGQQLPITPASSGHCAQAQTTEDCVADVGSPPSMINALQCICSAIPQPRKLL